MIVEGRHQSQHILIALIGEQDDPGSIVGEQLEEAVVRLAHAAVPGCAPAPVLADLETQPITQVVIRSARSTASMRRLPCIRCISATDASVRELPGR